MKKVKLVVSSHHSFIYVQFIACETKEPDPIILFMEEILHQLIGGLSHYLQDLIHARWLFFRISSINSRNASDSQFTLVPPLKLQL